MDTISSTFVESNKAVKFDLGGIGKGYLIDKVKNLLNSKGVNYFFINAGGDIYATSNKGNSIEFILESPFEKNQSIGVIQIKDKSIGASSSSLRKWKTQNTNKEVHHLIDYKTGEPVNNISGVFTLANNAVHADLASTALFVSPNNLHLKIAQELKIEYLIIFSDGSYTMSSEYPGILN